MSPEIESAKFALAVSLLNIANEAWLRKDTLLKVLREDGHKISDLEAALCDHHINGRVELELHEGFRSPPVNVGASGFGQNGIVQIPKILERYYRIRRTALLKDWWNGTRNKPLPSAPPIHLDELHDGPPANGKPKKGKKPGPKKPRHDPEDDRKRCELWEKAKEAGQIKTYREFESARGFVLGSTKPMVKRHKERERDLQ